MKAEPASGIRIMSDSLMPFQPAIEEPSNILPSVKRLSSTVEAGTETCCSLPRVSQKRKSTNFTFLSLICLSTSFPDMGHSLLELDRWNGKATAPRSRAQKQHELCHGRRPCPQSGRARNGSGTD